MPGSVRRVCALALLCAALGTAGAAPDPAPTLRIENLRIRDPFIYAHPETRTYYLYASAGSRTNGAVAGPGVVVFASKDLTHWTEPRQVFRNPPTFWGGNEVWAPEMHRFGRDFLLFVTFNGRVGGRGTQILRADSPEGPFEVWGPEASTPPDQTALDGTPWIEADGSRWLVYCHEWVQIGDGAMRAVRMTPDWRARVGEPVELFRASQAPWVRALNNPPQRPGTNNFVTDAPWFHRFRDGKLLMLWSSFGAKGYAVGVAESASGRIEGPWRQRPQPLFAEDGGHAMTFRTFEGALKLVLHQPNSGGRERARILDLSDTGDDLLFRPANAPAAYLFAHMTRQDYGRLYYSVSTDGLHWRTLNGGRRVDPGYRGHPDITRGHDGRFYLLGNPPGRDDIRLWVSSNLVAWSLWRDFRPKLEVLPQIQGPGGFHGAPKMFFDEPSGQYLLTWHSSVNIGHPTDTEGLWRGMRTLYVLSRDLVTFTEPKRLFPWEMATIDVLVRREGGRYFAILKDERYPSAAWPTGKTIRIAAADRLLGPYAPPSLPVSPNFCEAPMLLRRPDGAGWYLYSEQYPGRAYRLATAPALDAPWREVFWMEFSVPENARHGCMIELGRAELEAVLAAFGP